MTDAKLLLRYLLKVGAILECGDRFTAEDVVRQAEWQMRRVARLCWRPMDTAPTDGTPILAVQGTVQRVVHWDLERQAWGDGDYDFAPDAWLTLPNLPAAVKAEAPPSRLTLQ